MIKINFKLFFFIAFVIQPFMVSAQEKIQLTLNEVVRLARLQSPDALIANNLFVNSYWQHHIYKTDFLPKLTFDGTLPDFTRSIEPIIQPDGSEVFIYRNLSTSSANLSLTQNISYTGTEIFVNSGIRRIDIIGAANRTSYLSTPFQVGLRQPVFTFNHLRWKRKIEPLKYKEALRQYMESMEEVSMKAVNVFFGLYLANLNLDIALKNKANNDTLYKIAKGRYNLGKIAENELLQIELSTLNSNTAVTQAQLDKQIESFNLKRFLGFKENIDIMLITPSSPPALNIDYNIALEQARMNRKKVLELQRKEVESERDLMQAKTEGRFKANIFGTYGLTSSALNIDDAYKNTIDQQQFTFGLQVPIVDWGRSGANVKVAKANLELIRTNIEQENANFEQEIFLNTQKYKIQAEQFLSAAKADTIGLKRFEVAKQRYYIGKIDITVLNIAFNEKDIARRNYAETLRSYWSDYYNIRRLTLYDFLNNKIIDFDYKVDK